MPTQQKYFHDKVVLLLLSINTFLMLLSTFLVLFNLDSGQEEGYIVEYRSNLGISAFTRGDLADLVAFIVFAVLIAGFHWFISMKLYGIRRNFSIAVLSMGTLLLIINMIVSNALLVLR